MRAILTDKVFISIAVLIGAYWFFFPMLPRPKGSDIISVFSVCAGVFLIYQYISAGIEILFRQERRDGWIAIMGALSVGIGVVFSGGYILVWNRLGQPEAWISSATSAFGRFLIGSGLFAMGISHEVEKIGGHYPREFWRAVIVAFAIIVSFLAGAHFSG